MDPFTIAAIGLGIKAIGTGIGLFGDDQANQANQALVAAQKKAEAVRFAQMQNDAERARRKDIKTGILREHQAISNATLQGAGESSGAYGAQASVNSDTGWDVGGVNTAEHYGKQIYQANIEALNAKGQLADAQEIQQIGSGISSLGGAVLGNMGAISSLTTSATTPIKSTPFGTGYGGV